MMTQPQAPGGAESEPGMGEPIHLEGAGGVVGVMCTQQGGVPAGTGSGGGGGLAM